MRYINEPVDSKFMKKIIKNCFDLFGSKTTAELVDKIKNIGFEYAGLSGQTISIDDIEIPSKKNDLIKQGDKEVEVIDKQYHRGLISEGERNIKSTELWLKIKDSIEKEMLKEFDINNPVYMMVISGARGHIYRYRDGSVPAPCSWADRASRYTR
jgi:DNA-directed RNA polymerase subunit beta'